MPILGSEPVYFTGTVTLACQSLRCVILDEKDWIRYKQTIVAACIARGEEEEVCMR